jgi:hypothetical protein
VHDPLCLGPPSIENSQSPATLFNAFGFEQISNPFFRHNVANVLVRSQPVGATPSDMNDFSKGGVYGTRKTG